MRGVFGVHGCNQSLVRRLHWNNIIGTILLGEYYWDSIIGTALLGEYYWDNIIGTMWWEGAQMEQRFMACALCVCMNICF